MSRNRVITFSVALLLAMIAAGALLVASVVHEQPMTLSGGNPPLLLERGSAPIERLLGIVAAGAALSSGCLLYLALIRKSKALG